MSSIPPSGPSSSPGFSPPTGPVANPEAFYIMQSLGDRQSSPADQEIANLILNEFTARYPIPSGSDPSTYPPAGSDVDDFLKTCIENVIQGTGMPPCDIFITLSDKGIDITQTDLDNFMNQLVALAHVHGDPTWQPALTTKTVADTIYMQVNDWRAAHPGLPASTAVAQNILNVIKGVGSAGDSSTIKSDLDTLFTALTFPATCYGISAGDLDALIAMSYPPEVGPTASIENQLAQSVSYLNSLGSTSDDYKFVAAAITHLQAGWTTSSLTSFNTFWAQEITQFSFQTDYPAMQEATVTQMETFFGLTPFPLQDQFFAIQAKIVGPPALAAPDLALATALRTEIAAASPQANPATVLQNWWTDTYITAKDDVFMQYPLDGSTTMAATIAFCATTAGAAAPTPTPTDTCFLAVHAWASAHAASPLAVLATAIMAQMQGVGSSISNLAALKAALDGVMMASNFATLYPGITSATDLAALVAMAYPVGVTPPSPTFVSQFAQTVIYLQSLLPASDDNKFVAAALAKIQLGWPTSDLTQFNTFWTAQITNFNYIATYPAMFETTANQMETIFGIAAVPLQDQFFNTQRLIVATPLTGQDLTLAQALRTEIITASPLSNPSSVLSNWWTTTYISNTAINKFKDVYMQLPFASLGTITECAMFATGGIRPNPTTMDTWYRETETLLQGLTGVPDIQLYTTFASKIYDMGSQGVRSPIGNDEVDIWAAGVIGSNFKDYTGISPNTINVFLTNFPYKETIEYQRIQLMNFMMSPRSSWVQDPMEGFCAHLEQIINGYVLTHPTASAADLQAYLNTNYAKLNFCTAYPGVPPNAVAYAFNLFGVVSPHVYGPIDTAYSILNDYRLLHPDQFLPNSPIELVFNDIYTEILDLDKSYDPANPNANFSKFQTWLTNYQNTNSNYAQLTQDVKDAITLVLNL